MDFDSDTEDIYEVEKILDAKKKDGRVLYKVRWEGYGSGEDSWEPSDNLLTCQELVDRFWAEKKDSYKKRGRKPKRLKDMTEYNSDASDTEEGRKDQNDEKSEMTLPPQKRKRGRPPKRPILSEADDSYDRGSSSSPELSAETSAKKKRRRRNNDDEFSFPASEFLLLDYDIAPLGMTRQASKEIALVSLRKRQEYEPLPSSKSEIRLATREVSSSSVETKQNGLVKSLLPRVPVASSRETSNVQSLEENSIEVVEISSQSTEDEEEHTSWQDSESVKEYIVISSQSDSDGEEQDLTKTKLKKKTRKKEKSSTVVSENEKSERRENGVGQKKGTAKLKKTLPVEDHAKKSSQWPTVDAFPPIDFSFEDNAAVSEVERDKKSSINTKNIPEVFEIEEIKVFNAQTVSQTTDENSNQVTSSLLSRSLPSKFSVSKFQSLLKKSSQEKVRTPGVLDNNTKSDSVQKNTDLSGANKKKITSASAKISSVPSSPVMTSKEAGNILESNVNRRENNEIENSVTKMPIDMATSQLGNQSIGAVKRLSAKSFKGRARRTDGRPKSVRNVKKRLSVDNLTGIQPSFAASTKSPISENSTGGEMNETLGKPEKQMVASTTADLLPMQNKTSSVPLMDGDLIGAIIQDSAKIDESKFKQQTVVPSAKKEAKTQGSGNTQKNVQEELDTFKPWDSGMEDISDGEDDLSDFEFDLDDYSPDSFFNDVEETKIADRSSSPVVEPLNLSWGALKQAIREGDVMQVRRALAVPGFNPDMIDTASGMTLLTWAATAGQDEIVKLLLRRGAGVNNDQKRHVMTALMHAAEQGFPETVQILLDSGAHINWQTTAGETALMRACKKGHKDVVEVLLKYGVDTKAQTTYDLTAEQIASKNQHFQIQNLLADHEESMASTLQVALGKCLGTAGTLHLPLLMPYRCIAPGEKDSVTFTLKYNPSKVLAANKVVLFCVRADFNGDEVCLRFGGDNGVRTVLFNDSIQYPLVQGNRSVYLLTPDTEVSSHELTVQTHSVKTGRLIICVGNVGAATESS